MNHLAQLDWNAIYLTCFGVGLSLGVVAFVGGFSHLHVGHLKLGHLRLGGHHAHGVKGLSRGAEIAPINGFSLVAFFCWFGGTGYLLDRGAFLPALLVLLFAGISGIAGASLIYWFLAKVILPREKTLEPEDTEMVGVTGRVSATIPAGGVGEMIFSQNGCRRSIAIRCEGEQTVPREVEVIVMRYERGCAWVRRWDDFEQSLLSDAPAVRNLE